MQPSDLSAADFNSYPPLARQLAVEHLALLRQLPLSFLAVLLRELSSYDWRFPVERAEIERQLGRLQRASTPQLHTWMAPFAEPSLPDTLYREPWAAQPAAFVEKLTAYLWTVHAIDGYRQAAKAYEESQVPGEAPPAESRWCIVVVGRDAQRPYPDLFRQLRSQGTLFTQVQPGDGWQELTRFVQSRVKADAQPYRHWYVDGEESSLRDAPQSLCTVSYQALRPVREEVLRRMHQVTASGGGGPENLRSLMAQMRPGEMVGNPAGARDPVLENFELSLLTEGSGTQIFSTTFVQWAGREVLRRAQPGTLLMRYAPRQEDRPMNDLLLPASTPPRPDPEGSLVDASMGAYYTWLSLQRLPGAERSRFLAWRESGHEAVVIAPGMARGGRSTQPCTLAQILRWMA